MRASALKELQRNESWIVFLSLSFARSPAGRSLHEKKKKEKRRNAKAAAFSSHLLIPRSLHQY